MINVTQQELLTLLSEQSLIICDLFGVVHDGHNLYPGVSQLLNKLETPIHFISNAPRPNQVALNKLHELGLHAINSNMVTTSGDICKQQLLTDTQYYGKKIFLVDAHLNGDLLRGVELNIVEKISDADFFIMLSFREENEAENMRDEILHQALSLNLPMICPNPDKIVYNGNKIRYPSGYFAQRYEKMGGGVIYYGKPHPLIYRQVLAKYSVDVSNVLAIGDALETDIKGASSLGIRSVLVRSGIHLGEENLESLVKKYAVTPDFIVDGFWI